VKGTPQKTVYTSKEKDDDKKKEKHNAAAALVARIAMPLDLTPSSSE
jgi:hypothetical protein